MGSLSILRVWGGIMEYFEIMKSSSEFIIGRAFMQIGGIAVLILLIGCVMWMACNVWITASTQFRNIVKAESLIYEYKKYREQFLKWLEMKNGKD